MSHTPPTELEARPLRRVSSLVLNSPVLPVRRSEAKKSSGEENVQYGSSKAKPSDVSEEIVPDSEEERIRFIYTHILLSLLRLILFLRPSRHLNSLSKDASQNEQVLEISSDEDDV
jgi:hypothetical protein